MKVLSNKVTDLDDISEITNEMISEPLREVTQRTLFYLAIGIGTYYSIRTLMLWPKELLSLGSLAAAGSLLSWIFYFFLKKPHRKEIHLDLISISFAFILLINSYVTYLVVDNELQLVLILLAAITFNLMTFKPVIFYSLLFIANLLYLSSINNIPSENQHFYRFYFISEVLMTIIFFVSRTRIIKQQLRLQVLNNIKNEKLKTTLEHNDIFLANITHELRTPLTGILGMIGILKEEIDEDERQRYLEIAEHSSHMLMVLINDLLDVNKLENGKLDINPEQYSANKITKSVYHTLRIAAEEKDLITTIKLPPVETSFLLDEVRVSQILLNLLGNAIKFTTKGEVGINLQVFPKDSPAFNHYLDELKVDIPDCEFTHWLCWQVIDTGAGIDPEKQKLLFQRFEQFIYSKDSISIQKGTGLGLAISRQLARLMNGDIVYQLNKHPQGSTFTLFIPSTESFYDNLHPVVQPTNIDDLKSTQLKFLVAEDNKVNQLIIKKLLTSENWTLDIVENGQEAVNKVNTEKNYDAVLLDIMMPVMGGMEAVELIKNTKPDVPLIAITANVLPDDVDSYLENGFITTIAKPINETDFYKKLIQVLSQE